MLLKSCRRSVKLWDRSQECDSWRTVEQIVYNQVPQFQEQVVIEVVQITSRAAVPVVLAKYRPARQFRKQWRFHKCSSLTE